MTRILAARALPDGRYEYAETSRIIEKLRDGEPTLGWEGDPHLSLVLNASVGVWELWRRNPDNHDAPPLKIATCPNKGKMPGDELIRALISWDTRRHNRLDQIDAENAAIQKARDDTFHEEMQAAGDKLHWALSKDLGIPAVDGKLYGLGGNK
jgi:hypothetical protein